MSVLVAAALDRAIGEPPERVHPVVWAGRYLGAAEPLAPAAPPVRAVAGGAVVWLGGALISVALARGVENIASRRGAVGSALLVGAALWPLLSARMLLTEVACVETALARGPEAGREALARIVSRDTSGLAAHEVRAAALESLGENLSDSVVAPLLWYAVAGLPGAGLYRFANTADACWGYRTPRWQHAGRVAARVDDALNLVPARVTAGLLKGRSRWPEVRREARRTSSPNAGWPMAALALRLDVRLGKRGHYELNPDGLDPTSRHVTAGLEMARRAAMLAVAATAVLDHLIRRQRGGRR